MYKNIIFVYIICIGRDPPIQENDHFPLRAVRKQKPTMHTVEGVLWTTFNHNPVTHSGGLMQYKSRINPLISDRRSENGCSLYHKLHTGYEDGLGGYEK